jgi:hypothetical protein
MSVNYWSNTNNAYQTGKTKIPFLILLSIFKFNAVFSQNSNFSINTQANLGLVYRTATDFETDRLIRNAFRLNFGRSSRRMLVSARVISNMNYAFTRMPSNLYSITLSSTNASLSGNYRREFKLDFTDQNILLHGGSGRGSNVTYYEYDLKVGAIGYDYEPGQYFYSILFTLTEQ